MHLILMLSVSHLIPTLDKTGNMVGHGSLATGFLRAVYDYEVPARPWNLGMVLEVGSPYLVYSVRSSSPLRVEGLVRHMSESFRDRDYTPMTPALLCGQFLPYYALQE
jgi:hypothetical protein